MTQWHYSYFTKKLKHQRVLKINIQGRMKKRTSTGHLFLTLSQLSNSLKKIFFNFLILEKEEGKEGREGKKHQFIFRQRGREREREGKKYECVVASCMAPTGDLASNQACALDWESN